MTLEGHGELPRIMCIFIFTQIWKGCRGVWNIPTRTVSFAPAPTGDPESRLEQAIALYLFIRNFWCPWPDCCGHRSLHGEVNFCIHNRLLKSTGGNSLYEYQRTDKGAFLTAQALGVNVSPSQCTCPVNTALSCHPGQHLSQPTPEILVKLMSPTCQLSFHWTQSKRWDGIGHSELK